MDRLLFARGARGATIEKIQAALNFPPLEIDGIYGGDTEKAVAAFQKVRNEPVTGQVSLAGWMAITGEPLPAAFDRVLALTAAFEGHGFSLAQGNFDGAGVTWGIIGFTLKSGTLGAVVGEIERTHPQILDECFGANKAKLLAIAAAPLSEQIAWADSISIGLKKVRLAEPWLSGFHWLGKYPEVRAAQIDLARTKYFEPAVRTARKWKLDSELGLALCFDIHVQNGGIKQAAAASIAPREDGEPEMVLRERIANAVAESSSARWRENVRARKLAVARGSGAVHGEFFRLRNWGLDEFDV